MGTDDSDLEIADIENYRGDKLSVFNHQMLVMEVLRRINESGSHELRSGWFNEKMDSSGSIVKTYVEDTQKKFIEGVKTAKSVMSCDFDKEAEEEIERLLNCLEEAKKNLLDAQWKWFNNLTPNSKEKYRTEIMEGAFNKNLPWFSQYIEYETECYRFIAEELHQLTKRLDFYQIEEFEA